MATKPAFAQGAQVEHAKFGLGSVLSCNEEYIVIKWDDHGEKKFVSVHRPPQPEEERPHAAGGKTAQHAQESRARGGSVVNAEVTDCADRSRC